MRHVGVKAKVVRDNTGIEVEIPVILTEHGLLEPLVAYFLEHSHAVSMSWMQKRIQAVGLLLDYMSANYTCFDNPKELFTTFVQRLYSGTIGEDGLDPSGLYWLPRGSKVVEPLVYALSNFSDWLHERLDTEHLNPWREATRYEEMLNWAAYHHRHSNAFLGHTWDRGKGSAAAKRARNTLLKRAPKIDHSGSHAFPEDYFHDLLFKGFIVPGKQHSPRAEERLNLRDILITILQHYGSVRKSEPFHLYVHDVLPDPHNPNAAMVRIFHPSEGIAPRDWLDTKGKPIRCNREAYLRGRWQMRPRPTYAKTASLYAGWKGSLLDDEQNFMHVHWFPSWAGELFKTLWNAYLVQRALLDCDHPFAFVTRQGKPYAIRDYDQAHARAVERIGLIPAKVNGTTPHGHRHAYGQRMVLTQEEIGPIYRMKALHHKALESQEVYAKPTVRTVTEMMSRATIALDQDRILPQPNFERYGLQDISSSSLLSRVYSRSTGSQS